jgi:transposase
VVLLCAAGLSNTETAAQLRTTVQTVGKWRQRFIEKRLDGLLDEPRPGTPRKLSEADVDRVLGLTLESAPSKTAHWSTRSLAAASGLSRSSVHRIWRAFSLQPHREETFKLLRDFLLIDKGR